MEKDFLKVTLIVFTIVSLIILGIFLRINYLGSPANNKLFENENPFQTAQILGEEIEKNILPKTTQLSDNDLQTVNNLIDLLLENEETIDEESMPLKSLNY
jgi:hypothetical protein